MAYAEVAHFYAGVYLATGALIGVALTGFAGVADALPVAALTGGAGAADALPLGTLPAGAGSLRAGALAVV